MTGMITGVDKAKPRVEAITGCGSFSWAFLDDSLLLTGRERKAASPGGENGTSMALFRFTASPHSGGEAVLFRVLVNPFLCGKSQKTSDCSQSATACGGDEWRQFWQSRNCLAVPKELPQARDLGAAAPRAFSLEEAPPPLVPGHRTGLYGTVPKDQGLAAGFFTQVGGTRLELVTSCMSSMRSGHLS
jgi:hypothetical protein